MEITGSHPVTVVALHCSGATGSMWQALSSHLGISARFLAPNLTGAAGGPLWSGERAFTLDDEMAPITDLIDAALHPVHLVGHSYGGAVALELARARADKVASLTLYEPASFYLLKPAEGIEYAEIQWLAKDVETMLARGDVRGAMRRFTNYWGGSGAWDSLAPEARSALMRWAPKATLDFHALLDRSTRVTAYEQLRLPMRIIVGEHAPTPTREVADILCSAMPHCEQVMLNGAGHLGPITHSTDVATLIAAHIGAVARTGLNRSASVTYENGRAA